LGTFRYGKSKALVELNQIILGDCLEVMKDIPDKYFELAIVDPPYGHGKEIIGNNRSRSKLAISKDYGEGLFNNSKPISRYFNELKRISINRIIWGVNYFPYYFGEGRIIWDKDNGNNDFSDCEIAYNSLINSVRMFRYKWHGMLQGDMKHKEHRIHPTQKPVKLYKWLLKNYAKQGDKIIDTHAGSCSSVIACIEYGFEYLAIEKDPDYYSASIKRVNDYKSQVPMEFLKAI